MLVVVLLLCAGCGSSGPCPADTTASSKVDQECADCITSATEACIAPGNPCESVAGDYATSCNANSCDATTGEPGCSQQLQAVAACVFDDCEDFQKTCVDGE
jgi:hypothetical protein